VKTLPRQYPTEPPEPVVPYEGNAEDLPIRQSSEAALRGPWDDAVRSTTRAYWDTRAVDWTENMGPHHTIPLIDALERLEERPQRVLELGLGTGLGTKQIRRLLPEAHLVGTDISPPMLHQSRREGADAVLVAADTQALPFAEDSFDLVVILNSFLFPDQVRAVVKPGGTVIGAWSLGPGTPIYVRPDQAEAALGSDATAAEAAWGNWWRVSPRKDGSRAPAR
jgi:SAM-dependent methyltransferase